MERLRNLIGPAPSEAEDLDLLMERLRAEHARVADGLSSAASYSASKKTTPKEAKKINKAKALDALCKEFGLTLEEMQTMLKASKEKT